MASDAIDGAVYAVVRVRDAHGEVDVAVGDRRWRGWFLYKPKQVAMRDRLYVRLLAGDGVPAGGDTQMGVDLAGVVVAADGGGKPVRQTTPGATFTLRITTVQRNGVDLPNEALETGRLDAAPTMPKRRPSTFVAQSIALPFDDEVLPRPRAQAAITGTLQRRTMNDLVLQLVRDGTAASIEVTGTQGLGGTIFIEGGEVLAAWAGRVRGLEAVLLLATYTGAQFRVRPGATTVMKNVEQPAVLVLRALANVQAPGTRSATVPFADEDTNVDHDASVPSQG